MNYIFLDIEYYFGASEGWSSEEFNINDISVVEISKEEASIITRLLGIKFGTGVL